MIEKLTSVKRVVSAFYRATGANPNDISYRDLIEWSGEALDLIGAYAQYIQQQTKDGELVVNNFRVPLPCNFYKVIQMSYKGIPITYGGRSYHRYHCADAIHNDSVIKYIINDGYIIVDLDDDEELQMSFIGYPIDEEGFPKIPDDVSYLKACTAYCINMWDMREYRKAKITADIVAKSESDWHWYCGQARGRGNMPSIDDLELIKNMWQRIVPNVNAHASTFLDVENQERFYDHGIHTGK